MIDKYIKIIGLGMILIASGIAIYSLYLDVEENQIECMYIDNGVMLFDKYIIDNSDIDNHPDYTFYLKGHDISTIRGNIFKDNNSYCYFFKSEALHYPYNENGTWVWR